jgi:hypothetical protein
MDPAACQPDDEVRKLDEAERDRILRWQALSGRDIFGRF